MELTRDQFFDYIFCPAHYDLSYNKNLSKDNKSILYRDLLNKATNYFFVNLLNNKIITQAEMKDNWDKICEKYKYFITPEKIISGIGSLVDFLRWAYDYKPIPVDVESFYNIVYNNLSIQGHLPVVLINNNNYEIFYVNYSSASLINISNDLDYKLKYTLDHYAFTKLYGQMPAAIKVFVANKNEILTTTRTRDDYTHLESTFKNVALSLENNIYYSRENVFCSKCQYRQLCKYYK